MLVKTEFSCASTPVKRVLTDAQAKDIYRIYLAEFARPVVLRRKGSISSRLAVMYGVSSKTIRDIWNRRTWKSATSMLVSTEGCMSSQVATKIFLDKVLQFSTPLISTDEMSLP